MLLGGWGWGELAKLRRVRGNVLAEEGRPGISEYMGCSIYKTAAQ